MTINSELIALLVIVVLTTLGLNTLLAFLFVGLMGIDVCAFTG